MLRLKIKQSLLQLNIADAETFCHETFHPTTPRSDTPSSDFSPGGYFGGHTSSGDDILSGKKIIQTTL